ncbi:hypothetical protein L21SP5_00983 [Salinivirga cyanobacteriivorans]|uniref:Uncharacterized protein n=1 Tax=Salinivirga cyanobacteriivorans TaxID=1307839 RepID=A0A0S2HX62_9BACT|nr:hypothetical protein L21SP5_00983 [Salinivirga cyanobacteriivorans]
MLGTQALARFPYFLAALTGSSDAMNRFGDYILYQVMDKGEPVVLGSETILTAIMLIVFIILMTIWLVFFLVWFCRFFSDQRLSSFILFWRKSSKEIHRCAYQNNAFKLWSALIVLVKSGKPVNLFNAFDALAMRSAPCPFII